MSTQADMIATKFVDGYKVQLLRLLNNDVDAKISLLNGNSVNVEKIDGDLFSSFSGKGNDAIRSLFSSSTAKIEKTSSAGCRLTLIRGPSSQSQKPIFSSPCIPSEETKQMGLSVNSRSLSSSESSESSERLKKLELEVKLAELQLKLKEKEEESEKMKAEFQLRLKEKDVEIAKIMSTRTSNKDVKVAQARAGKKSDVYEIQFKNIRDQESELTQKIDALQEKLIDVRSKLTATPQYQGQRFPGDSFRVSTQYVNVEWAKLDENRKGLEEMLNSLLAKQSLLGKQREEICKKMEENQ